MSTPDWKVPDGSIEAVLGTYGKDLTAAAVTEPHPIFNAVADEMPEVAARLSRASAHSLCFMGRPGSGKSAMINCFAQYIAAGKNLPNSLDGARVIQIDMAAIRSGAKFRGQVEEKLKPILQGLTEREGVFKGHKIILACDELPPLMGDGSGNDRALEMFVRFMSSPGNQMLVAATPQDFDMLGQSDPGFARRFDVWEVLAPGERGSRRAARQLVESFTRGAAQPVPVMKPLVLRRNSFGVMGKGLFA